MFSENVLLDLRIKVSGKLLFSCQRRKQSDFIVFQRRIAPLFSVQTLKLGFNSDQPVTSAVRSCRGGQVFFDLLRAGSANEPDRLT